MATTTRKRMLSPEMWDDKDFNKLSYLARLLFIGLITVADDEGRLPANCQFLKNNIFGYDKISIKKVEKLCQELTKSMKNVRFYTIKGEKFCQLLAWERHQYLRKDRMRTSNIPSPRGYIRTTESQPTDNQMPPKNRIEEIRLDKKRKEKPFFNNLPLIKKKDGTWWVIHGIGDWREFCGESSQIEWR